MTIKKLEQLQLDLAELEAFTSKNFPEFHPHIAIRGRALSEAIEKIKNYRNPKSKTSTIQA